MNRRNFLKIAGVGGAMIAIAPSSISGRLYAADGRLFEVYENVQLVDANGEALKASLLQKEVNYLFNYPFIGTPAILLDLGKETQYDVKLFSEEGEEYGKKGGSRCKEKHSCILCNLFLSACTPNAR